MKRALYTVLAGIAIAASGPAHAAACVATGCLGSTIASNLHVEGCEGHGGSACCYVVEDENGQKVFGPVCL